MLGWPLQLTYVVHRRARHRLHGVGRHPGGEPDADAPDGRHAGRHGRWPFALIVRALPARRVARRRRRRSPGALGRMNAVQTSLRPRQPLQLLVGPHGGFFLALVLLRHRPVAGAALPRRAARSPRAASACSSTACSRCPMQFVILFVGRDGLRLLPVRTPPLFFNPVGRALAARPHAARVARARGAAGARSTRGPRRRRAPSWPRAAPATRARRPRPPARLARRPAGGAVLRGETEAAHPPRPPRARRPATPTTSSSGSCCAFLPAGWWGCCSR